MVPAASACQDTIVNVIGELSEEFLSGRAGMHARRFPIGWVLPVRRVRSRRECLETSLVLRGLRGRARLLFGMVRDNRQWQLVPSLSSALAAAAATAAFGVFYSSIWGVADALTPARLAQINVFAIGAMVSWFILYNGLWESPRGRSTRQQVGLYNASTVLTLVLGVVSMYVVLFLATLLAALAVISAEYLRAQLGHPVGLVDYLSLTWLSSSMGIVAGALGSSLESEDAVPARRTASGSGNGVPSVQKQDERARFVRPPGP